MSITTYATDFKGLLKNSQQLIVVTSAHWNSSQGKLQRYQYNIVNKIWQPIGASIDVMLGKNGMAKIKKEGDLRVPSGIFSFGKAFGFTDKADPNIKLPYFPITNNTVCVDDSSSPYYNRIIDSNLVPKNWRSGEYMREQNPQYTWGIVVNYNTAKPKSGAGSCIFMHIWSTPDTPTVGCISMSAANIKQILTWLDPLKKPIIVVFPINTYEKIAKVINLPILK